MGPDLSLATGDAFDVKVKPVVEKRERLGLFRWRTTMHYTLTNALPRGVTVDLLQDGLWGDTRIVSERAKSDRQSAAGAKRRVRLQIGHESCRERGGTNGQIERCVEE